MDKNKSDLPQPGRFYLIWQCLERLAELQNITCWTTLIFCCSRDSQYEIVFYLLTSDWIKGAGEESDLIIDMFILVQLVRERIAGPWSHLNSYRPHLIGQN